MSKLWNKTTKKEMTTIEELVKKCYEDLSFQGIYVSSTGELATKYCMLTKNRQPKICQYQRGLVLIGKTKRYVCTYNGKKPDEEHDNNLLL